MQDYTKLVREKRDQFFSSLEGRFSQSEIDKIKSAYFFAEKAHEGQKRYEGVPYITHPMAVASIINDELGLGCASISAALLHDVVEDTEYEIEDIESEFGKEVAFLVDVVTKKKKDVYEMSKQVDNFDQMLNSIHYDIRALLIKLADRLHNMRTLKSMKIEKQVKVASETDYFYAPLANRLGLYKIKSELENLSLQYRSPYEYTHIKDSIDDYVNEHAVATERWLHPIRTILKQNGINAHVSCDKRSVYSLWSRMQKKKLNFKELEHIRVVNIVFYNWQSTHVSEKDVALKIYSLMSDLYTEKPSSMINYIDIPKENGYRSMHCKFMGNEGRWMEIHICSQEMLSLAQDGCVVERKVDSDEWIAKFKRILKDIATHSKEGRFMEDVVSSFYNDNIIVFDSEGSRVSLPKDATALDFAYDINIETGNAAKYAIINDRLCSIKSVLKRGDRVKVGTGADVIPKLEQINHVKTYKARNGILQFLRKPENQIIDNLILCGECKPIPGDEVVGFKSGDKILVHKCNCAKAISMSAQQGDIIQSVDFTNRAHCHYPIDLVIKAVNRDKLLCDLIQDISINFNLSLGDVRISTIDEISDCKIQLYVHSLAELEIIVQNIRALDGVYEVKRV